MNAITISRDDLVALLVHAERLGAGVALGDAPAVLGVGRALQGRLEGLLGLAGGREFLADFGVGVLEFGSNDPRRPGRDELEVVAQLRAVNQWACANKTALIVVVVTGGRVRTLDHLDCEGMAPEDNALGRELASAMKAAADAAIRRRRHGVAITTIVEGGGGGG